MAGASGDSICSKLSILAALLSFSSCRMYVFIYVCLRNLLRVNYLYWCPAVRAMQDTGVICCVSGRYVKRGCRLSYDKCCVFVEPSECQSIVLVSCRLRHAGYRSNLLCIRKIDKTGVVSSLVNDAVHSPADPPVHSPAYPPVSSPLKRVCLELHCRFTPW